MKLITGKIKTEKCICFILDSFEIYKIFKFENLNIIKCYSYFDTEEAINSNIQTIFTYDLGHLSFDLEDLGYNIYIGYKGRLVRFYVGMSTANGKELRKSHNLIRLLLGGALDNDLNIKRNKFFYDSTKSTSDLCQEEFNRQKALFNFVLNTARKTIGFEMTPISEKNKQIVKINNI